MHCGLCNDLGQFGEVKERGDGNDQLPLHVIWRRRELALVLLTMNRGGGPAGPCYQAQRPICCFFVI